MENTLYKIFDSRCQKEFYVMAKNTRNAAEKYGVGCMITQISERGIFNLDDAPACWVIFVKEVDNFINK